MNNFLYSVLHNKCPNCKKGNFFSFNNPYNLRKFDSMNKKCPVCGMGFIQEPGFYLGAAIISYGMQAALLFLTYFFLQVLVELKFWYFVGSFFTLLVLLAPLTFRISRLIWINIMGTKPQ